MFYNFHATESNLQLICINWLSISDLLAQVEVKNRLRNGTLILQVVKDGDSSKDRYVGVLQAQDTIKRCTLTTIFHNAWTEQLISTYKVPNLWERRVFPLTDMWSGARTGLGCIAIKFSEKNWGWALTFVDLRRLDQAGRGIWVPSVRGCEC